MLVVPCPNVPSGRQLVSDSWIVDVQHAADATVVLVACWCGGQHSARLPLLPPLPTPRRTEPAPSRWASVVTVARPWRKRAGSDGSGRDGFGPRELLSSDDHR